MGKKLKFSGNLALLKHDNITGLTNLKEGKNIEIDNNDRINLVDTPDVKDVLLNNVSLINELNNKYTIKKNVVIEDNKISLNLGEIDGLQTPTKNTHAVNKKYVDESLDYFWEQIQAMNFVNFKGRYNDRLTYGMGDLVAFFENNNWYFYLSIIDLNNEPLTSTKGWIKISSPIPNNLVTEDRLNLEVQKLEQKIENADNDLIKKINELEQKLNNLSTPKMYYARLDSYTDNKIEVKIFNSDGYWSNNAQIEISLNQLWGFTDRNLTSNYNSNYFKETGSLQFGYSLDYGAQTAFSYLNIFVKATINNINYKNYHIFYIKDFKNTAKGYCCIPLFKEL